MRTKPHITAVMQGRSELHGDGLPLVPKHRAQPPLSPPLRGPTDATNIHVDRLGHGKKKVDAKLTCEPRRLVVVMVVVVVCAGEGEEGVKHYFSTVHKRKIF